MGAQGIDEVNQQSLHLRADVVVLPASKRRRHPEQTSRSHLFGRRWLSGINFVQCKGVHTDSSNGLQALLSATENSCSTTSSVVLRRHGSVNLSSALTWTASLVKFCEECYCHPTISKEEFDDVAVRDVKQVVHTSPGPGSFGLHSRPLCLYHNLQPWDLETGDKRRVLDMGGPEKSTRGKHHCKTTAAVAGENERTNFRTNSPVEDDIEKYVCYTFATDAPDGWIEPDSNGLYSKDALAYFSGGGSKGINTLMPLELEGGMESGAVGRGGLSNTFSMRTSGRDEDYSKFQQEFLERETMVRGKGVTNLHLNGFGHWEQNGGVVHVEHESSNNGVEASPTYDEGVYFNTRNLSAELQEASDAWEEMEDRMHIKLMVSEAILKGIVRALEVDVVEVSESREAELVKVKQELLEKDSLVTTLIHTIKKKEEELCKLVEESRRKERRLVMDMLTERDRVLGKVQESEKYIVQKEKEVLKMAEHIVELALNLDAESRRVSVLEKQIKESKEAEALRGRELMAMMEKTEQFRAEKESIVEMVRRESRLKELRLTDNVAERDIRISDQLETIKDLESGRQELREMVSVQSLKMVELEKSRNINSELLEKLREENRLSAERLEEKEESLRCSRDMIEHLNCKIQGLISQISTLNEQVTSLKDERESQQDQILKQINALEETKDHYERLSLSEQHLQQEVVALKASLQMHDEVAKRAEIQMEERCWMYEVESGLIMTTLEGSVRDLEKEISLFGEDSGRGNVSLKSPILQKRCVELDTLRSAKECLEQNLEDAQAVVRSLEESIKTEQQLSEEKLQLLSIAGRRISCLEQNSSEKEIHLQRYLKEMVEMRKAYDETQKEYEDLLEGKAHLVREAQEKISNFEEELRSKQAHLGNAQSELEEKDWRLECESMFLSTYMENSFQALLKEIVDLNKASGNVQEKLVLREQEVEALQVELCKCKVEVESLKIHNMSLSGTIEELKKDIVTCIKERAEAREELHKSLSESEKLKVDFYKERNENVSLRKDLEEKLYEKEHDIKRLLERIEESTWQSQVEDFIVLGCVEGAMQRGLEYAASVGEELKQKNQELASLLSEVEEQKQRLALYASDVSNLNTALLSKSLDLCALREDSESRSAMQRDALVKEQSQVIAGTKEIEKLKKLKDTLLEKLQEEKFKWQQLEEELVEEKWKYQVEMDIVITVMWEAKISTAGSHAQRDSFDSEVAQLHEELVSERHCDMLQQAASAAKHEVPTRPSSDGIVRQAKEEVKDGKKLPTLSSMPLSKLDLLVRQNEELRWENEKLLEQKTEEIYKLKREFYKELEKVRAEHGKLHEPENLERKVRRQVERAKEPSGSMHQGVSEPSAKQYAGPATFEKIMADQEKEVLEMRGLWDTEKSSLLESISKKDEELKEVSGKLSQALEKERKYVVTHATLMENLAALQQEKNLQTSAHVEADEKLTASLKILLEEKGLQLSQAVKETEEKSRRVAELGDEASHLRDEVIVLQSELITIQKQIENEFAGQIQTFIASLRQLETEVTQKMKHYNLRLQRGQSLFKHLLQQFNLLALSEVGHIQNLQNLQKAETEVDLLGDEVDALMDVLEKVYTVLSHYHPVIQHYPGLADLGKVVRQEVLQRICDSDDVSL